MLQNLRIVRQFGMNDEAEIRQVDATRGHVGGDANARASVAERLERVRAFALRQLARKGDDGKPAFEQRRLQMIDRAARIAEDDRAG
jgi:hypothetical protein